MNQLSLPLPPQLSLGAQRVQHVIKYLRGNPIKDTVVVGKDLGFLFLEAISSGLRVTHPTEGTSLALSVHSHALGQLCSRVSISRAYIQGLLNSRQAWATQLVLHNLQELYSKRVGHKRFLIRAVDGQLRGMLSNAYKRLDSAFLVDEFAKNARAVGARPFDAFTTDLRVAVQAILPQKWKVKEDEISVGVMMRNSDFGAGPAEVKFFITTGGYSLVSQKGVKRTHRGRRLREEQAFNDRIKQEDSGKIAEDMQTHIVQHLEPSNIEAVMAEVELSASTKVDVDKVEGMLKNLELTEEEISAILVHYSAHAQTLYQLASAIAWVASSQRDMERKLDLMDTAGGLLMK
jgi:hypothetical protein